MDSWFDFGSLEILGFYGLGMGIVAYDIIKTRREIAADKAAAVIEAAKIAADPAIPASEGPRSE